MTKKRKLLSSLGLGLGAVVLTTATAVSCGTDQAEITKKKAAAQKLKEKNVIWKITQEDITAEIKKTSTLDKTIDAEKAKLNLTLNFEKDGVKVTAIIKKGDFDRINGTAVWTSSITTEHVKSPRTDVTGTIKGLLLIPIAEVEDAINLTPTTTLTTQFANKIISTKKIADFGLTLKALGLDALSAKISAVEVTQGDYDFKNNIFNATISFDFQPDVQIPTKVKGTFDLVIDGFKAPKLTPADPAVISGTDFKGMKLPKDFKIPATVKTVASGAFAGTKLNDNFQVPDTVTSIGSGVFRGSTLPAGFKMPKAWSKTVGASAFVGAKLSKGFVIPATVKEIGPSSFKESTFDSSFTIPDTVETIATTAFKHDHHKLPAAFRLPVNPKFTTITTTQFQNTILNDNFEIPANVTTIEGRAFANTTLPIGFKVPLTVKTIGFLAFWNSNLVAGAHMEDLKGNTINWAGATHVQKDDYAKKGIIVVADKPTTTPAPTTTKYDANTSIIDITSNTLESKEIYSK